MESGEFLMADAKKDVLTIPRVNYEGVESMLPLKVTKELHSQVKSIAQESGLSLSTVACMMIEFAVERVKIVDGEE